MQIRAHLARSLLLLAALTIVAAPAHGATSDLDRIATLRQNGRYEQALAVARTAAVRIETDTTRYAYEFADVERLVATLEWASKLDGRARRELAEADGLVGIQQAFDERGEYAPALVASERQFAIRNRLLGADNVDTAASLDARARFTWLLHGSTDPAERLQRESLALRQRILGTRHPETCNTMERLAELLNTANAYAEAESLGNVVLATRRELFGDGGLPFAAGLRLVGKLAVHGGDRVEAQKNLEAALALQQRLLSADDPEIARTMMPLGVLSGEQGQLAAGCRLLETALSIQQRRFGVGHVRTQEALSELGILKVVQGSYDEALEVTEQALRIQRQYMPEHSLYIETLNILGIILNRKREYVTSEKSQQETLRVARRVLGNEHITTLYTEANLGFILVRLAKYSEADSVYENVSRVARRLEAEGKSVEHLLITILDYRAEFEDRRANFEAAETLELQVLARHEKHVDPATRSIVIALDCLATARIGKGDLAGAETYLTRAAATFDKTRLNAGLGTAAATFMTTPYARRALVRLELGRGAEAWEDVERSNGRLLADSFHGNVPPCALARIQASLSPETAIVGWLDHDLRHKTPRSWAYVIRDTGPVRWVRLALADSSDADAWERVRRVRDQIAGTESQSALGMAAGTLPEAALRRLWNERITPVEPHLGTVRDLVVVSSNALQGIPVEIMMDPSGRFLGERWTVTYSSSASIHTWIAERSGAAVNAGPHALLVGDPPLRAEHLASMQQEQVNSTGTSEVASEPSRGVDPSVLRGVVEGDSRSIQLLPRLRWSRSEVAGIARTLPNSTLLLGPDASEARIADMVGNGTMSGYRVVHFATHAIVDDVRPERSALVLSQIDSGPAGTADFDGVVTGTEIEAKWRLGADLVVLSACETALGKRIEGEGVVGFAYPFLKVGAHGLLASLWRVDDKATSLFMQHFYEEWKDSGDDPSEGAAARKARALKASRAWLRAYEDSSGNRPYAHPRYWAAFVLIA